MWYPQCALLSFKMLYGYSDCCLFFSFPCNFNTKVQIQVRKTKGMIFLWIIDLFPLLVRLSLLKYFSLGNTCISGISHWMFGFQARSNSFTWKSFMQLSHSIKPNSPKKSWVHTYNFWSQSNIEFGYQTKWNSRKGRKLESNNIECLNSKLLMTSVSIIDPVWKRSRWWKVLLLLIFPFQS